MCPAYKRYFESNSMVFLTVGTAGRLPIFGNAVCITSALEILKKVKTIHSFGMKAYVVMPDHLHLLIHIDDGRFDRVMHSFKRNVSFEFHKRGIYSGEIWQKRYYDHIIRDDTDFSNHLDYIHFNPVKHNKVQNPSGYKFSSFHYYLKRGWYSSNWGNTVPDHIKHMDLS